MEFYFDISDLINWNINHLSGIQRVTVGLLNGSVDNDVDLILVAYDDISNGFYVISPGEISPEVHKYFNEKTKHLIRRVYKDSKDPNDHSTANIDSIDDFTSVFRHKGNVNISPFKKLAIRIFNKLPLKELIIDLVNLIRKIKNSFKKPKKTIGFSTGDIIISPGVNWTLGNRNKKLFELKKNGIGIYALIYDIIPIKNPDWVIDYREFKKGTIDWIMHANQIFTISNYSKKDIMAFCEENRITKPDIRVIRLADSLNGKSKIQDPQISDFTNGAFFICVSSVAPHKNQQLVVEAWKIMYRKFKQRTPKLIFIGSVSDSMAWLKKNIEGDQELNKIIHFNQDVDDNELEWYYHHCRATIYPSFYEGWGLPVGESLARGKICLASNATSIPEVGGALVEYFYPNDSDHLASLVEKASFDLDWVAETEARIRSGYKPTAWKNTASQFFDQIINA